MRFIGPLFLLYLFAEIASIILLGSEIGAFGAFMWLIATFCLGIYMLRNVGLSNIILASTVLKNKTPSFYQTLWPLRFTFAALLFMIPGLVSDIFALILMIPFSSAQKKQQAPTDETEQDFSFKSFEFRNGQQSKSDDIIEGEYSEIESETKNESAKNTDSSKN